jgi:hypothetical protein
MLQEANIRRNTGAGANHDQWRVKAFRQMEGGVGFDEYGDFLSHLELRQLITGSALIMTLSETIVNVANT